MESEGKIDRDAAEVSKGGGAFDLHSGTAKTGLDSAPCGSPARPGNVAIRKPPPSSPYATADRFPLPQKRGPLFGAHFFFPIRRAPFPDRQSWSP